MEHGTFWMQYIEHRTWNIQYSTVPVNFRDSTRNVMVVRRPNQQRTLNRLPTELRCGDFVTKHQLSMQVGARRAKTCTQCVRIPTELQLCMPPLVAGKQFLVVSQSSFRWFANQFLVVSHIFKECGDNGVYHISGCHV